MMNPQPAPAAAPDTRAAILDAAQVRLLQFGYHKTTMAEIADDAGMSAANLYRYFANKAEIAAECATRCLNIRLERLRSIAVDQRMTAAERLRRYALELVDDNHALAGTDSKIGELVATITRQRPSLVHEKMAVHHSLLGTILRDGVANGEFAIADIERSAVQVYSSFALFDVPLFVGLLPRSEFDARARGVVDLLLDGLRRR
jgi:AcrR family transcriptional regulator